jgi:hypothetical protein
MPFAGTSGRVGARTQTVRILAALAALTFGACEPATNNYGPVLPPPPPDNPQLTRAAFIFHVNTQTHQISIEAPSGTVAPNPQPSIIPGLNFSLIAGDGITLTASNYFASTVGQYIPGKVRVRFDLSITNKLSSVQLITPTFPAPPPGVTGVLLFPFATHVTVTSGGVSVGGSGDTVFVELPNTGQVAPSVDWDGNPYNFFNDADCTAAGANDCYRYEAFAAPVAAGATTLSRTIGFDLDPTVANFSAKIIVAADLQNSGPAPTGTIAGTVTSPQRGALSGVTVTANTGGFTGTTNGTGAYSIANVTTGSKTVSLSGLPTGCTDPGSQVVIVNPSATTTVNFSVTCTAPSGTVSGTITLTGTASPSLDGTVVTATPLAAGTTSSSTTLAGGLLTYSIPAVQIGTGTGAGNGSVALSNLPAGCTTATGSYTGLTLGGTQTVNFTVNCVPPPAFYQYNAVWGAISGGSVTLTLNFDPSTLNDPAINGTGADDYVNFQAQLTYSTRLTFVSCGNGAGSPFTNATANSPSAGTLNFLNFKTGAGVTTAQVVGVCTFTVTGTGGGSTTTNTTIQVIDTFDGHSLVANTQKHEGTLTLP